MKFEQRSSPPAMRLSRCGAILQVVAALMVSGGLTGCVVMGGSRRGGFFIWPGSLGLLLLILLFVFLSRRR